MQSICVAGNSCFDIILSRQKSKKSVLNSSGTGCRQSTFSKMRRLPVCVLFITKSINWFCLSNSKRLSSSFKCVHTHRAWKEVVTSSSKIKSYSSLIDFSSPPMWSNSCRTWFMPIRLDSCVFRFMQAKVIILC